MRRVGISGVSIWYCPSAVASAKEAFEEEGAGHVLFGYMALSSTLNFSKLQVLLAYLKHQSALGSAFLDVIFPVHRTIIATLS
jgi:hypothetical protein